MAFSLEQYKTGRVAVARNGQKFKFVGVSPVAKPHAERAIIVGVTEDGRNLTRTLENGTHWSSNSALDLVGMVPEAVTLYGARFRDGALGNHYFTDMHGVRSFYGETLIGGKIVKLTGEVQDV